jgi:Animal haem peroxidase
MSILSEALLDLRHLVHIWSIGGADPRFTRRMFPNARACRATDFAALTRAMTLPLPLDPAPGAALHGENDDIPAGYTYLGQFVNHDITNPTKAILLNNAKPAADRTPALDLDSIYGRGPAIDPGLYVPNGVDTGIKLETGPAIHGGDDIRTPNLPRKGQPGDPYREPNIAEPRNDDNLNVAQIHASFIMFHNEMVDELRCMGVKQDLFAKAQEQVRWHYQWVVLWDFLTRICGGAADITSRVGGLDTGSIAAPHFRYYIPSATPGVPLEFWAAAFRFGHAMVRPLYYLNDLLAGPVGTTFEPCHRRIPIFKYQSFADHPETDLRGGHYVPNNWKIAWNYFFPFGRQIKPWTFNFCPSAPAQPIDGPQKSMMLKPAITAALSKLPGAPGSPDVDLIENDLLLSALLDVPSGQSVAEEMLLTPLNASTLAAGVSGAFPTAMWTDTPLFYYVLREAEVERSGRSLGAVSRNIVVETLIGLLWDDLSSFLRKKPTWTPWAGARLNEPYTMAHFLTFAYRGKWGIDYPPRGPWRADVPKIRIVQPPCVVSTP